MSEKELIEEELPEIQLLEESDQRTKVVGLWEGFLSESTYSRISECPALPGVQGYDLASHTRHVVANALSLARSLEQFAAVGCDRESLVAACLVHDASKLVEYHGPLGAPTEIGRAFLHAQLAGVRCLEVGLPLKVAHMVSLHPYTPPHVHVRPQYIEFVILSWADIAAVDPVFFRGGAPTHLEIGKRFFELG